MPAPFPSGAAGGRGEESPSRQPPAPSPLCLAGARDAAFATRRVGFPPDDQPLGDSRPSSWSASWGRRCPGGRQRRPRRCGSWTKRWRRRLCWKPSPRTSWSGKNLSRAEHALSPAGRRVATRWRSGIAGGVGGGLADRGSAGLGRLPGGRRPNAGRWTRAGGLGGVSRFGQAAGLVGRPRPSASVFPACWPSRSCIAWTRRPCRPPSGNWFPGGRWRPCGRNCSARWPNRSNVPRCCSTWRLFEQTGLPADARLLAGTAAGWPSRRRSRAASSARPSPPTIAMPTCASPSARNCSTGWSRNAIRSMPRWTTPCWGCRFTARA